MNIYWKKAAGAAVIGVAFVGAVIVYQINKDDNPLVTNTEATSASEASEDTKVVKACDVVTQADAEALLGSGAIKADSSIGDTSSDDINVSTCSYTQAGSLKTLTLLARSARTNDGVISNKSQFKTGLPASAQNISGLGDAAYWDPAYGQLNILEHNNWYILSSGGLKPADKSLDDAKAFATRVMSRL